MGRPPKNKDMSTETKEGADLESASLPINETDPTTSAGSAEESVETDPTVVENDTVIEEIISEVPVVPGKILSAAQAIEFVRSEYEVPASVKTVHVTSDRNVFYDSGAAQTHARQKNLKLFSIRWD